MKSDNLEHSLNFLSVEELQDRARWLSLSDKGKKGDLVARIVTFVKTGKRQILTEIPAASCAQRGKQYPLEPSTLMLKGAYKNDAKTRAFFKQLIGQHFHFTAFGIDWLTALWIEGKPPTYQQFARMWERETQRRKTIKATPKAEWAYINFVQKEGHRFADRDELIAAWNAERARHKQRVDTALAKLYKQ